MTVGKKACHAHDSDGPAFERKRARRHFGRFRRESEKQIFFVCFITFNRTQKSRVLKKKSYVFETLMNRYSVLTAIVLLESWILFLSNTLNLYRIRMPLSAFLFLENRK